MTPILANDLAAELTIPVDDFPSAPCLTVMEDLSSPRPATAEVFFEPTPDRSVVHPPEILVYRTPTIIPLKPLAALLLAVLALVIWRLRSKRTA